MIDSTRSNSTSSTCELLPLLTVREAAQVLRISDRTLWTLTNQGEIPAVKVGRSVRYDRADLMKWIAGQKTA